MVQEIAIKELFIHPKNVRKHYEGIEELADSIKEKGILQNLTVIPGHYVTDEEWKELTEEYAAHPSEELRLRMDAKASGAAANGWSDYGYTVVIGNRRLTAARIAGIETAPCNVTEMSEQEQVSTMLLENMQRKDLTAYEESAGIQMCLDLGVTEDELSKKTGLSKKTIKHRTKMQLLDQETVEEKCAAGATIFDFIKLEQIKNIDKRNEVLEFLGTPNFNYKLESAVREEKQAEARAKVEELFASFAEKVEGSQAGFVLVKSWYNDLNNIPTEKPEDAGETKYCYTVASYGICLYREREDESDNEDDEAARQRAIAQAERDKRNAGFEELGKTFYEMRKKWILDSHRPAMTPGKLMYYMSLCFLLDSDIDWKDGKRLYGLGIDEEVYAEITGQDQDSMSADDIDKLMEKGATKDIEKLVYSLFERGGRIPCKNWQGEYEEDELFCDLYLFLMDMGYVLSDDETKILGGTHDLYKEKEEASE